MSARPRAEAVEQLAEHLPLAGGGDPAGVEHSLGAEPVNEDEQLVGRCPASGVPRGQWT